MRETYARVLAGALMTGAIAAVVGMSALFETGKDAPLRVVAPPATLQRPVPIEVAPAAVRPQKHAVRRAQAEAGTRRASDGRDSARTGRGRVGRYARAGTAGRNRR
jgi:hypothetical protein